MQVGSSSSYSQVIQSLDNQRTLIAQGKLKAQVEEQPRQEVLPKAAASQHESAFRDYAQARSYLKEEGLLNQNARDPLSAYRSVQSHGAREDVSSQFGISAYA